MSRCGCQSEAGRWTWGRRSPRGRGSGLAGRAGTRRRALRPQGSLQPWKRGAWKQRTLRPPRDHQTSGRAGWPGWLMPLSAAHPARMGIRLPKPPSRQLSPRFPRPVAGAPFRSSSHFLPREPVPLASLPRPSPSGRPAFLPALTPVCSAVRPLHSDLFCEVQDMVPYSRVSSSKSLLPVSSQETHPAHG